MTCENLAGINDDDIYNYIYTHHVMIYLDHGCHNYVTCIHLLNWPECVEHVHMTD